MTIRTRVIGGLLLLICFAAVEALLVGYVRTLERQEEDQLERTAATLTAQSVVWRHLEAIKASRRGYLLSGLPDLEQDVVDGVAAYESSLAELTALAEGTDSAPFVAALDASVRQWQARWPELTPMSMPDGDLVDVIDTRFQAIEAELQAFADREERALVVERAETERIVVGTTAAMIGIPILGILVMIAMLFSVHQSVLRPLGWLTRRARDISAGKFPELRPVERTDEIGTLLNAATAMVTAIRDREAQLAQAAGRARDLAEAAAASSAQAQLAAEELQVTIDAVPVAILIIEPSGTVRLQNRAARQMMRAQSSSAQEDQKRFTLFDADGGVVPPDQWPHAVALRGEAYSPRELRARHADGEMSEYLIGAVPLWMNNEVAAAIVVFQDVSAIREVDRLKEEFVSIVSHELRTPLTSIRGSLQLVLSDEAAVPDAGVRQLLQIGLNNSERLIRIINDILDISKIEAGRMVLHRRPVAVAELVTTALQSVESVAAAGTVTLESEIPDDLPHVDVDADRMVQAVVNLVGNAVKFSPPGAAVTVRASAAPDGVVLAVIDRGPGIRPEDQDRLFRKFEQVDSSSSRRKGGTGLGLPIARAIVEQHGGRLTVQSVVGEGTTFTMTIPGAREEAPVVTAPVSAVARVAVTGRHVLVVDDDPDFRLVTRRQLEAAGYVVAEARDGASGLEAARASRPDVITLDLMMPGMDGWEFLAKAQEDAALRDIPVIVVSAVGDADGRLPPHVVTLAKPVRIDDLLHEARQAAGQRAPVVLVAEDDDDLRGVLVETLRRRGMTAIEARDGAEAVERFAGQPVDMVLLDIRMPRMDGFQVIERIRSGATGHRVPILVISGSDGQGQAELRAFRLGATAYLPKPVDALALAERIEGLIGASAPADEA